jgi:ankyrin repeat protein
LIDLLSAHGTEWDKADKDGWTPLFFAVAYGHPDFARSLVARGVVVDHRAVNGDTALHVASRNGDVGAVSVMLDAGADVNARQQDGNTPLMLAFRGKKKDRDIAGAVRTLLAHSADPKIAANNGWTALHWAVNQMSSAEVIEQLIKAGADVNAVDHAGRTPLHAVCMSGDDGLANNVRVLIRHGARTDLRDSNGKLAADYPKAGSDTARALAEAVK